MFILAVRNDMQNQGKSLITNNIANTIATNNPDAVVWLIDTDPQGTIIAWSKVSPNLPKGFRVLSPKEFEKITEGKGRGKGKPVESLPDFLIVDTERGLTKENPDLAKTVVEDANMVLIPVVLTKGFKEYGAMVDVIDALKAENQDVKFSVLFNRVKTSDTTLLTERLQYAKVHNCNPLTAYISDDETMASIFEDGSLPQYVNNTTIPAQFDAVWKEINSQ